MLLLEGTGGVLRIEMRKEGYGCKVILTLLESQGSQVQALDLQSL